MTEVKVNAPVPVFMSQSKPESKPEFKPNLEFLPKTKPGTKPLPKLAVAPVPVTDTEAAPVPIKIRPIMVVLSSNLTLMLESWGVEVMHEENVKRGGGVSTQSCGAPVLSVMEVECYGVEPMRTIFGLLVRKFSIRWQK